jgi:hypothetical protein
MFETVSLDGLFWWLRRGLVVVQWPPASSAKEKKSDY